MKDFNHFSNELKKLEKELSHRHSRSIPSVNVNDPQVKLMLQAFSQLSSQIQIQVDYAGSQFSQQLLSYVGLNFNTVSAFTVVIQAFPSFDKFTTPIDVLGDTSIVLSNREVSGPVSYEFVTIPTVINPITVGSINIDRLKNQLILQLEHKKPGVPIEQVEFFISDPQCNYQLLAAIIGAKGDSHVITSQGETISGQTMWNPTEKMQHIFSNSPALFFRGYMEARPLVFFFSVKLDRHIVDSCDLYIPLLHHNFDVTADMIRTNCIFAVNHEHRISNPIIVKPGVNEYSLAIANNTKIREIKQVAQVFLVEDGRRMPLQNIQTSNFYLSQYGYQNPLPRFMVIFSPSNKLILDSADITSEPLMNKILVASLVCVNTNLDEYSNSSTMTVSFPDFPQIKSSKVILGHKREMRSTGWSQLLKFTACNFIVSNNTLWQLIRNWIDLFKLYEESSNLELVKTAEHQNLVSYLQVDNIPCPVVGSQVTVKFERLSAELIIELHMFKAYLSYYIPFNSKITLTAMFPQETINI